METKTGNRELRVGSETAAGDYTRSEEDELPVAGLMTSDEMERRGPVTSDELETDRTEQRRERKTAAHEDITGLGRSESAVTVETITVTVKVS